MYCEIAPTKETRVILLKILKILGVGITLSITNGKYRLTL